MPDGGGYKYYMLFETRNFKEWLERNWFIQQHWPFHRYIQNVPMKRQKPKSWLKWCLGLYSWGTNLNHSQNISYPDWGFSWFFWIIYANNRVVYQITTWSLLSSSFTIQHPLIIVLPNIQTGSGACPVSYPMGTRVSFYRGKVASVCEADHPSPFSAKVMVELYLHPIIHLHCVLLN
jgi:hypothetical protein